MVQKEWISAQLSEGACIITGHRLMIAQELLRTEKRLGKRGWFLRLCMVPMYSSYNVAPNTAFDTALSATQNSTPKSGAQTATDACVIAF